MKRKDFLSAVFPLGATLGSIAGGSAVLDDPGAPTIIPPYLKKGDTIGITCPAGYIRSEEIRPAMQKMEEWGFRVQVGDTVGKKDFTLGGTDEERKNDFQQMLDDKGIRAIMCARGGYGTIRIIDALDFKKFSKNPKWIIGFSDITVIHAHLNRNFRMAAIHSKMCNSFPEDWSKAEPVQAETIESICKCLTGEKMNYLFLPNIHNKTGIADGELVGGNLKMTETLAGTKSDISTRDKILFLEDTGEYLYSIDRMFWNLKRTGKLSHLKGLIIGGFKPKPDDPGEEFGKTLEEIVLEKVSEYTYPLCFDFPVGHQKNNFALKCGMMHRLSVHLNECRLNELR